MGILDRAEHVHGTHCPLEVQSKMQIGSKEYELTVGATRIADTMLARGGGVQNPGVIGGSQIVVLQLCLMLIARANLYAV
jgi:hypothetical protein